MTHSSLRVASVSLAALFDGTLTASDGTPIVGQLTLPEYQRPYRWHASQVVELANDLARHFKQKPPTPHAYYLGSLILHQSENNCLNIIDGQQRITSMGILCLVARITCLPSLGYTAPESQQRIRANIAAVRQEAAEWLSWLTQATLSAINVTLVVTDSEDDAYRFFETQNSGGVRLSGIDIAKAHHLREVSEAEQDSYAKIWEAMRDLPRVVDAVMRGRFWQSLDWRELASPSRQPRHWRDQVVSEMANATGGDRHDRAYHLAVTDHDASSVPSRTVTYDLRQPLQAGCNSIHYLQQFQRWLADYCPQQLPTLEKTATTHSPALYAWQTLYCQLVANSQASVYLRRLYDATLLLYLSRFGAFALQEAGLWLFRAVYSLRLSNDLMVRENSVQKFAREIPLLDWIAHSYTHQQLIDRLRRLEYNVSQENLDNPNGKKRQHIDAVRHVLNFWHSEADISPALIAARFDTELRGAIIKFTEAN